MEVNDARLTIYDRSGRKVFSRNKISGDLIELKEIGLNEGVYYLELSEGARIILSRRVIIIH